MGVLQIRKAERSGARLVIGLCGRSGDGKTVTAIHLAYGLANYDASKVGFIDTENRRGSLNAHVLREATRPTNEPFLIGDLYAPFSPQRYADAILEFQDAGVEVLVIDSTTHEWEGVGGCQDIAGDDNKYWNKAKRLHRTPFMSALLQSNMHIIACVRARPKVEIKKDSKGKTEYIDIGIEPVCEKNFMFELTASLMMCDQGKRQIALKIPGDFVDILGRGEGYITADDGKAIRDWVDGGVAIDPKVEKCRNGLISNAEGGVQHLQALWDKVAPKYQQILGKDFYAMVMKSAAEFDQMKIDSGDSGGETTGSEIAAMATAGSTASPPSGATTGQASALPGATTTAPAGAAAASTTAPALAKQETSAPAAAAATPRSAAAPAAQAATRTPTTGQSENRPARPANHAPPATAANKPVARPATATPPASAPKALPDEALF